MERDLSDIAVLGRVIEIRGDRAKVELGGGVFADNIVISLVNARVGDYVLIHRGYAIKVLSEEDLLRDLRKALDEESESHTP